MLFFICNRSLFRNPHYFRSSFHKYFHCHFILFNIHRVEIITDTVDDWFVHRRCRRSCELSCWFLSHSFRCCSLGSVVLRAVNGPHIFSSFWWVFLYFQMRTEKIYILFDLRSLLTNHSAQHSSDKKKNEENTHCRNDEEKRSGWLWANP